MHYILERGGKKIMKKRWFVVVLTIGLLLCVLPPSALALSPDPTITDADGNILGWSDLSTVPYSLDDLQEQRLAVVDEKPGTAAAPGLWETGSEKSLADADSERLAVVDAKPGRAAAPGLSETGLENSLADEGSDEATDGPSAANPTPQLLDEEPDPADNPDSTTTSVCKIEKIDGTHYYSTLDAAIDAATEGDQIDLLTDIELYTGLDFRGRTLTISGGGRYELTLKENGIYAFESTLTFQDLTLNLYANKHTYEDSAGKTANLISNSNLHLKRVTCTISPEGNCGSGMFLYQKTNLYLDDSEVTVDTVNGSMVNGIYADNSECPGMSNREVILKNSRLKATGCSHAGLMLDPIDMTLNSSEVEVTNNKEYGLSLYDGELTMNASTLKATDNDTGGRFPGWHFGIYVGSLNMDGASALEAYSNGGSGLGIGSPNGSKKSYIRGHVTCEYNGDLDTWFGGSGGGLYVYAEHDKDPDTGKPIIYEGDVTIESGATVSLCNNAGLSGIQNSWILKIASGAHVSVDGNDQNGIYNSLDAQLTIEGGAYVSANNNQYGIYNCAGGGDRSVATGFFLIEDGAHVTANNNSSCGILNTVNERSYGSFDDDGNYIYNPENDHFTIQGVADVSADGNGFYGIFNNGGIFTIENGANVSVCNNSDAGILNNKHGTFTMETGANVSVCNNSSAGIFNTNSGTLFTVERNVDLQVEHNQNSGIVNNDNATLTLLSGRVRYNTTSTWYGGGLRNYSTATLSDDVQLYNNHAEKGGDDIENGTSATITFGPTGRGWELDGDPDCYDFIDGWYDDYETTRWNAHEENGAKLHMVLVAPVTSHFGPLSLKAAHGSLSTGSLTVRKETTGELLPSDYDTAFTFELTLDDDTITTIDDQWCGVPFKNGKASFTLKSGESITLSNLPAGIGYTITEAAQDNWTLMNINDAETGVVPRNDTAEVVFTNLKNSLDLPDVPILPILPIEPEEPEEPEIPEIPNEPEKPQTPEKPEGPETPKETETLQETEAPAQDQTPGELPAEEPAQADTAVPTQPVETPTQNTTAETLIQTGTTDWLAAVLMFSGFGLLVCGWVFNRKQRAKKH